MTWSKGKYSINIFAIIIIWSNMLLGLSSLPHPALSIVLVNHWFPAFPRILWHQKGPESHWVHTLDIGNDRVNTSLKSVIVRHKKCYRQLWPVSALYHRAGFVQVLAHSAYQTSLWDSPSPAPAHFATSLPGFKTIKKQQPHRIVHLIVILLPTTGNISEETI